MCYTDEDDELWNSDPQEFIRKKYDFYEDSISKVSAAQSFLHTCCKKRKDMLKNTLAFAGQVLGSETSTPRQKDGGLHIIGTVADLMQKKNVYKKQINDLILHFVFPFFTAKEGYLRARASWVLYYFGELDFQNDSILHQALVCLQTALIQDNELPVKVQAATTLQIFISEQVKAKQFFEPNLNVLLVQYLNIVKDSQNDDVISALQKVIVAYGDLVIPISVDIIGHLVNSIDDTNTVAAMEILVTIDTILMMIESKEVLEKVEPVALRAVFMILEKNIVDLYDDCFNIVTSLTEQFISTEMWKVYEFIYKIITSPGGYDYFSDTMSALHNFLIIDPAQFMADPHRVQAFYEIVKTVVTNESVEDIHCNVFKLIEVLFLQYRELIANTIPQFTLIVFTRYMNDIKTDDLKIICIQILIVVFYISPELFFKTMEGFQPLFPNRALMNHFFKDWIESLPLFYGVHDRKVCILGLSRLLQLNPAQRGPILELVSANLIPDLLQMFANLKEAYKNKANAGEDESSDDERDYSDDEDVDSADDEEEFGKEGIVDKLNSKLQFEVNEMEDADEYDSDSESDIDDDIDENELTTLESFETDIDREDSPDDEYVVFCQSVEALKSSDPVWYQNLFGKLTDLQVTTLNEVYVLAQQRKNAAGNYSLLSFCALI